MIGAHRSCIVHPGSKLARGDSSRHLGTGIHCGIDSLRTLEAENSVCGRHAGRQGCCFHQQQVAAACSPGQLPRCRKAFPQAGKQCKNSVASRSCRLEAQWLLDSTAHLHKSTLPYVGLSPAEQFCRLVRIRQAETSSLHTAAHIRAASNTACRTSQCALRMPPDRVCSAALHVPPVQGS